MSAKWTGLVRGLSWRLMAAWLCAQAVQAFGQAPRPEFQVSASEGNWQYGPVTSVLQSREGYVWVGTYHGLARFDGVRFRIFDSVITSNLPNSSITSLYETEEGTLWIGHETGHLSSYRDGQFQPVILGGERHGGPLEAISTDAAGDLWVLKGDGLFFRVKDGQAANAPARLSGGPKNSLAHGPGRKNYLVSDGKPACLEGSELKALDLAGTPEFLDRVMPARAGGFWVVSSERIGKWQDGSWLESQSWRRPPGIATDLLELRSGLLLLGTLQHGLYLLEPGAEPRQLGRGDGLSHNWIRSLCEDHEGNVWVGTGAGLDLLRPRKVRMLSPPDHWQGCTVLSFIVKADGSAWIGTEGAGLYRYVEGRWTNVNEEIGSGFIWSVLERRGGELMLGTWGSGLRLLRAGGWIAAPGFESLTAPITSLFQGREGELWIGTTAGIHRSEGNRITWFAGRDSLSLPDVRAITQDREGVIWFGMSGGGLGRLNPLGDGFKTRPTGELRQFTKKDGLSSDFVICLLYDSDDTLWIGTSENGLTRLKDGKFSVISSGQGLPNRSIFHIVDDGLGRLWMGSQGGILHASKADLNRCADGTASTVPFLSYGQREGLGSEACSGGFQPGACRGPDGRLWFPTSKGLAVVDPAHLSVNFRPPPVLIEDFLVDGKPIVPPSSESAEARLSANRAINIPPGKKRFEFVYTGLSFVAPNKVQFKHMLEGLDMSWVDAGSHRSAEYSFLRPGAYRFHVLACNNDGVWNNEGASLAFIVQPYFWQTWWFRGGSLLAGATGLAGAVLAAGRRRLRRKLEQVERQRALERERARIARDIHDDLGASLTRIGMLSQSVQGEVGQQPEVAADVDQIYTTARELTRAMDEIVWAVNPQHDTLDSLMTYLGRFAQHFLSAADIRCRLDVPLNLPPWILTSETRHNVYLAVKEALNNVVRHAAATEVKVSFDLKPKGFVLRVVDNGRGFDLKRVMGSSPEGRDELRLSGGNGLANMRRRIEEIGGTLSCETSPGEGTRIRIEVGVPH